MRATLAWRTAVVAVVLSSLVGCDQGSGGGGGPAPVLAVESSKDLGNAEVGMSTTPVSFTLSNAGNLDLEISALTLKGAHAADFQLNPPPLPLTLKPGDSLSIAVAFTPSAPGVREASLCVVSNSHGQPGSNEAVELKGGGLPEVLSGPDLTLNPNQVTPLAALLELETDVPTRVRVVLDDGSTVRVDHLSGMASLHERAVLGMYPQTNYTVTIEIETVDGVARRLSPSLQLTTPPLPAGFPLPDVLISDPSRIEPGVVLYPISSGLGPLLVALDQAGKVVWYMEGPNAVTGDLRRIKSGNLLGLVRGSALEIDMLGNVVQQWASQSASSVPASAIRVAAGTFHHEIFELPSGNFVTLSREGRSITDYPSSDTDPLAPRITATISGDVVVEFQPDGTVVSQWSLLDVLDPRRIGYDATPTDWSHGNAVIHDPRDESFIVSLRHQDCLVKIDRFSGDLVWILGTPDNWGPPWDAARLQGDASVEWPYHQHAPMITQAGDLLLFDNGNHRESPFDPPLTIPDSYSRAVIYGIDESSRSVRQLWSYGGPGDELYFAFALSDADELPTTGNILVTEGFKLLDAPQRRAARLVEVTRTQPAEKVFEALFDDPSGVESYTIYRAEKLPSLYP